MFSWQTISNTICSRISYQNKTKTAISSLIISKSLSHSKPQQAHDYPHWLCDSLPIAISDAIDDSSSRKEYMNKNTSFGSNSISTWNIRQRKNSSFKILILYEHEVHTFLVPSMIDIFTLFK